ncbi:hypothetical protein [Roseibium algae]|uniref:Nuclease-like protein n=1 Tax=Roseibium algae TaxID=3123038 RepID=A0ABU8TL38_9HYPH
MMLLATSASLPAKSYELPPNLADHPCLANVLLKEAVPVGLPTERGLFPGPGGAFYIPADIQISNLTPASLKQSSTEQTLTALPAGEPDRWGHISAWIVTSSAKTSSNEAASLLQDNLIAEGGAIAAPRDSNPACSAHLLEAEELPRTKRQGLWGQRQIYATMTPNRIAEAVGTYAIAEGRIVSLGKTASTRYLNFGRHWKTDFTATLSASSEALFQLMLEGSGVSLDDLAERTVRLRGVIEIHDGPLMRLTHPGQLAVIGDQKDKN